MTLRISDTERHARVVSHSLKNGSYVRFYQSGAALSASPRVVPFCDHCSVVFFMLFSSPSLIKLGFRAVCL